MAAGRDPNGPVGRPLKTAVSPSGPGLRTTRRLTSDPSLLTPPSGRPPPASPLMSCPRLPCCVDSRLHLSSWPWVNLPPPGPPAPTPSVALLGGSAEASRKGSSTWDGEFFPKQRAAGGGPRRWGSWRERARAAESRPPATGPLPVVGYPADQRGQAVCLGSHSLLTPRPWLSPLLEGPACASGGGPSGGLRWCRSLEPRAFRTV